MTTVIFSVLFYLVGGVFTTYCITHSDTHVSEEEKIGLFLLWPVVWVIALIIFTYDLVD